MCRALPYIACLAIDTINDSYINFSMSHQKYIVHVVRKIYEQNTNKYYF